MDQFDRFGGYTGYTGQPYGGMPQGNDPYVIIQQQKKDEKHGIFIAAAKLGALLIIYEVLTTALKYGYYYMLYYIKSGKFTIDFDVVRKYFREHPKSIASSFYNMLGNLSIVSLSMIILLFIAVFVFKVDLKSMLSPSREKAVGGAKWFSLSMTVNVVVTIIVSIFVSMLSSAGISVPQSDFSMTDSNAGTLIMQFLYVIAIGPICEELLYRGVIISLLKPYGKGVAVFFSAFLFGYMHGNIPQFMSAFAGGLVFAAIAVKYDSIIPTIVMHMLNNITASISDFTDVLGVSNDTSMNYYYGIVIFCAVTGMYMLFVHLKDLKPVEEKNFVLTSGERYRAVFLNIVMLIYIGYVFTEYISSFITSNK